MPRRSQQTLGIGCRGATGLPATRAEPYFPGQLTLTHACRKLTTNCGASLDMGEVCTFGPEKENRRQRTAIIGAHSGILATIAKCRTYIRTGSATASRCDCCRAVRRSTAWRAHSGTAVCE